MEIQWWAWETDSTRVQSQVRHLFAGWAWKGHMTSLSFSFLIHKTEIVIQPIECTNKADVAQRLKNLPAMQETWVWSLGWEDPLEKEMAAHSSILAQEIPWTEEPGRLQSMGSQTVRHHWVTFIECTLSLHICLQCPSQAFPARDGYSYLKLIFCCYYYFLSHYFILIFYWLCLTACRILVPWPGTEPRPPAAESWSLNCWIVNILRGRNRVFFFFSVL